MTTTSAHLVKRIPSAIQFMEQYLNRGSKLPAFFTGLNSVVQEKLIYYRVVILSLFGIVHYAVKSHNTPS
jgi:hypothetical protein